MGLFYKIYGGYGKLKTEVSNINLSILIICKNGPSITNTISNLTYNLYLCKSIFLLSTNILMTKKLLVWILNWVDQNYQKNDPPNN